MSVALDLYDAALPVPAQPAPRHLRAVPESGDSVAPPMGGAAVARLHAPAGPAAAPPLRLTHRGVAVVTLVVAALAGLLVWLAAASAPAATTSQPVPAAVTVHAGDTLWSIAAKFSGGKDPRSVVADIQQINHLTGADLAPGQVLRLR